MELIYHNDKTLRDDPVSLDCVLRCVNLAGEATDKALALSGTSVKTDGRWTKEEVLNKEASYLILRENADTPVGAMMIAVIDDVFHVKSFAILEKFQHMGYGKKLMEMAMDYAKEKGCSEARLGCAINKSNAASLYRTCGFKPFTMFMFRKV